MFKFDPKTNAITMTMTITWEDTVSRCWHYYHNATDEEHNENLFPDFDKLTDEEKSEIMQDVAKELDYWEPSSWTDILNVVDRVVREFIQDTYELDDDCLDNCERWADYTD